MSAAPRVLADAEARRRIAEELDTTLVVEAAAGTGKTTALVGRILAVIRRGATTLERVVAVTFTEKAAGEMKLRLRAELEAARQDPAASPAERDRFEAALGQLELARIGTIHSFCADLLHERPVEAGVDPLFEVAAEDANERLVDQAFESWFQRTLADPPEGVRRALRRRPRRTYGGRVEGPRHGLRAAVANLVEHRDFPAAWKRVPFARDAAIDAVLDGLAELAEISRTIPTTPRRDFLAENLAEVARFVAENRLREEVRPRDHDGLEADLRVVQRWRSWRWRGYGGRLGEHSRREVLARRDAVKAELDAFLAAADADLAACLREDLRPVVELYETLKAREGRLDFLDLLIRARDLVRDDAAVRRELQQRTSHFFVDEFQDTDPLQAELLLLLAAADPAETDWTRVTPVPGKLFIVGDPKQSIYRFRRADVAVYEATKRRLLARGAELVHLRTSFRGLPSLQGAVNAAFAPLMPAEGDGTQARYVALEPYRAEPEGRPTLVALPVPRPYVDYGNKAYVRRWQIEASLPDAVGAFVEWLVRTSGWTVTERDRPDQPVPLRPRHVCLLFRRFKSFDEDVTRPYVRALEARDIPHVLLGGRSFFDREEVLALRNALWAIEWPDDELRVFATLRGPFVALGDDALLAYRHRFKRLHPLRRLGDDVTLDDAEREVADALAVLRRLHAGRNRRPIATTLSRLLEELRAHAGVAIWPAGEQALANCLRVIELARRFERGGAQSFRAFVEWLEQEAERGVAGEAPVVEEGTEGVRIMTVHRAKGLEFPVVVLADPTCRAGRDTPTRFVDPERGLWAETLFGCAPHDLLEHAEEELRHDAEEAVRLTYVAATRARDLLVVPTVGDEAIEGWLDVLNPAVHPDVDARRSPQPAPGCVRFGTDSVLERPPSAGPKSPVLPGLHRAHAGGHPVVWWDPAALALDREPDVGLRQHKILEADEAGTVAEEGVRAHEAWQEARRETRAAAGRPSRSVRAVTAAARAAVETGAEPAQVAVGEVDVDRAGRPHGKRFGTLVHATLAVVDLDADAAGVRSAAAAQGRVTGATGAEIEAAAAAVEAALAHPLLRRAAACREAGALRRESPITVRRADGELVEGVVDLAFREAPDGAGEWTVVDFKTDVEIAGRRAEYAAQVRLYVEAVRAATGEPAHGLLLTV